MWAALSEKLQQKIEENTILKKAVFKSFTFSFAIGIFFCYCSFDIFNDFFSKFQSKILFPFIVLVLVCVIIGFVCSVFSFAYVISRMKKIIYELSTDSPKWELLESEYMASDIRYSYMAIKKLHQAVSTNSQMVGFAQLASQVAHDIRSPLAALDMVLTDLTDISEQRRVLIRSATNRIRDIANNLLNHHRENIKDEKKDSNNFTLSDRIEYNPELISDLILSGVSEKRVQYNEIGVDIVVDINEGANSAFAKLSSVEFKRVFSNLLNNAIESTLNKKLKKVFVFLTYHRADLVVSIQDEGCGIDPQLLNKIMNGEMVSEKKKGNGLGLSYAKKVIEKHWQGQLAIESRLGEGTSVHIHLPKALTPSWFASTINVTPSNVIVILDDDEAIHQIWLNRFKSLSEQIKIVRFYKENEFSSWLEKNISENLFFLIDYELIGDSITGLEIIDSLKISSRSFLVTSRYEESSIRAQCEKLGVQLIPKNFAVSIPISIFLDFSPRPELILIDDNKALTEAWSIRAKMLGKHIITYNDIQCFIKDSIMYNYKNIPLYIDSNLGEGLLGQEIAKDLYENGFVNIYLCTGYEAVQFGEMFWIKSVVGKAPPF